MRVERVALNALDVGPRSARLNALGTTRSTNYFFGPRNFSPSIVKSETT